MERLLLQDGILFKLPREIQVYDPVNKAQGMKYNIEEVFFLHYSGEYGADCTKIMLKIKGTNDVLLVDYGLKTHAHYEEDMWFDFPTNYEVFSVSYNGVAWSVLVSLLKVIEIELDRGRNIYDVTAKENEIAKLNKNVVYNKKYFFFIDLNGKLSSIWLEYGFEMPIRQTLYSISRFIDGIEPR